jgi:hypothetical protein
MKMENIQKIQTILNGTKWKIHPQLMFCLEAKSDDFSEVYKLEKPQDYNFDVNVDEKFRLGFHDEDVTLFISREGQPGNHFPNVDEMKEFIDRYNLTITNAKLTADRASAEIRHFQKVLDLAKFCMEKNK